MNTLKNILLFLIVLSIVSAVSGTQSANIDVHVMQGSTTSAIGVTQLSTYGRLFCLLYAIGFAAFYYTIHKRLFLAWQLGWIVVASTWLGFTVDSLSYSLKLPSPDIWIASITIIIGGCAGLAYWGVWWKRQKSYFISSSSK
jgi:hypothetical protein